MVELLQKPFRSPILTNQALPFRPSDLPLHTILMEAVKEIFKVGPKVYFVQPERLRFPELSEKAAIQRSNLNVPAILIDRYGL
jgi:hypothetical protein